MQAVFICFVLFFLLWSTAEMPIHRWCRATANAPARPSSLVPGPTPRQQQHTGTRPTRGRSRPKYTVTSPVLCFSFPLCLCVIPSELFIRFCTALEAWACALFVHYSSQEQILHSHICTSFATSICYFAGKFHNAF